MNADRRFVGQDHARVFGSPGERPRLAGLMRAIWPLFGAMGLAGYLVRAAVPLPPLSVTAAGVLLLLLAVALAAAIGASRRRLTDYLKGARGEEKVARELAFLPAAYRVFHGLQAKGCGKVKRGADYDHVVIGPTGVFVIETKNWSAGITIEGGRVLYDGREPDRPPLAQVKAAAADLRRDLSGRTGEPVQVAPVICFAGNVFTEERAGVQGVVVCNVRALNAVILDGCEPPFASEQIDRVSAALKSRIET